MPSTAVYPTSDVGPNEWDGAAPGWPAISHASVVNRHGFPNPQQYDLYSTANDQVEHFQLTPDGGAWSVPVGAISGVTVELYLFFFSASIEVDLLIDGVQIGDSQHVAPGDLSDLEWFDLPMDGQWTVPSDPNNPDISVRITSTAAGGEVDLAALHASVSYELATSAPKFSTVGSAVIGSSVIAGMAVVR